MTTSVLHEKEAELVRRKQPKVYTSMDYLAKVIIPKIQQQSAGAMSTGESGSDAFSQLKAKVTTR